MKTLKGLSLDALKGLLKLHDETITNQTYEEWQKFRTLLLSKINRLEIKHANKERKVKK